MLHNKTTARMSKDIHQQVWVDTAEILSKLETSFHRTKAVKMGDTCKIDSILGKHSHTERYLRDTVHLPIWGAMYIKYGFHDFGTQ